MNAKKIKEYIIKNKKYKRKRTLYQKFAVTILKIGNRILTEEKLKNSYDFSYKYVERKLQKDWVLQRLFFCHVQNTYPLMKENKILN